MEFSEFAFRVILLFLPGVLCGGVVDALTIHSRRKPFTVVLRALVFGMGAYYLYGALMLFEHGQWIIPHKMVFFRALQDKQVPLSVGEIGVVCLFACVEGVLYSFCSNRKWGYRLARRFGITQTSFRRRGKARAAPAGGAGIAQFQLGFALRGGRGIFVAQEERQHHRGISRRRVERRLQGRIREAIVQ